MKCCKEQKKTIFVEEVMKIPFSKSKYIFTSLMTSKAKERNEKCQEKNFQ